MNEIRAYIFMLKSLAAYYRSQSHRELEGILPQRSTNQSNFVGHGGGFRARPPLPRIGGKWLTLYLRQQRYSISHVFSCINTTSSLLWRRRCSSLQLVSLLFSIVLVPVFFAVYKCYVTLKDAQPTNGKNAAVRQCSYL